MVAQQVVAPPARAAMFLTLVVAEGREKDLLDVLTNVTGLTRSVSFRSPDEQLLAVVGIGAALWDRLWGEHTRPRHLVPFEPVVGPVHTAPATPGDLLVHLRATTTDVCFQLAKHLVEQLDGIAHVVDEVHGFKFYGDRDLLGFVDGSENPEGDDAVRAVVVGDEDPAYAGGSYVLTQKYLHDLDAWQALTVEQQEAVIGRSKLDNIEKPDADKAPTAHIALTVVHDDDGTQLQILRDNMPFGRVGSGEFGTYFIGYARDPRITRTMLENMVVGRPAGTTDAILEFSTAHTGALFFVPSARWLDDPTPVARESTTPDRPLGNRP